MSYAVGVVEFMELDTELGSAAKSTTNVGRA